MELSPQSLEMQAVYPCLILNTLHSIMWVSKPLAFIPHLGGYLHVPATV